MDYINYENNVAIQGGNAECLGVKEEYYWNFVEVDNFISPILRNQIDVDNIFFITLLNYGNEYIEKLSVDEDKARSFVLVIDSSIHEKAILREEFDISDEGKELHSLKTIRKNDKTPITLMSDDILNRD